jgi:hypothetical protein
MKNQAIQDLALDVHQATVVATAREEQGAIRMRATVPTEATAILGLVRSLGPRVHVAFEEGTQARKIALRSGQLRFSLSSRHSRTDFTVSP